MASGQGFAANEPVADDLENVDLANTSQILKKIEGEAPEEHAKEKVLIQASAVEEDTTAEDKINKEEGMSPEKASLLVGTTNECGEDDDDEDEKHKYKTKQNLCYICGDIGHHGNYCQQVTDCFICSKKGHLAIYCPNKNVEVDCTSRLCLKCGSSGHDMFSCTNDYDPEDLKAIECYICKKVGHLCCVDYKTEGPREASCYNCGQSGHFGPDCTNEVANNLQTTSICSKCRDSPCQFRPKCIKAAAKAARRKARRARRDKETKPKPTVDASQSQPNRGQRQQIDGPYHRKPSDDPQIPQPPSSDRISSASNSRLFSDGPRPTSSSNLEQPSTTSYPSN